MSFNIFKITISRSHMRQHHIEKNVILNISEMKANTDSVEKRMNKHLVVVEFDRGEFDISSPSTFIKRRHYIINQTIWNWSSSLLLAMSCIGVLTIPSAPKISTDSKYAKFWFSISHMRQREIIKTIVQVGTTWSTMMFYRTRSFQIRCATE